jgi:hypothetical protein
LKTAGRLVQLLLRPQYRAALMVVILAATALGFARYGWHRWGAASLATKEYAVTPDRIVVTPQPAWIHADVKADALRVAGMGSLKLTDPQLVEHLAQAFSMHPWIASVERVQKRYPARVDVEVRYRRPVLVVKIDAAEDQGLLFLDEEGVLLPSADFAPSQARDYLRIAANGEAPAGAYGTAWGSQRMVGAARVAAALDNRWQKLGLYWLVTSRPASGELLYELRTQDDRVRVVWGPAAGHESPGEASPGEKIAALERYVQDKGPLSRGEGAAVIDLRTLARGLADGGL